MIIKLSPQISDNEKPEILISKDVLIINNEFFDFSNLNVGDKLPASAINSQYFDIFTDVTKGDNGIELTLILPTTHYSSENARFPQPIVQESGKVVLPE